MRRSGAGAGSAPAETAVDGTFAPHAMPKLGGGYEGFNIDLAEEIAKTLKRKSTIDALQFSASCRRCRPALTTIWRRRPQSRRSAPTTCYHRRLSQHRLQFLIKKGAPKVEKLEDLKGKTISVNKGSAYDSWARRSRGQDRLEGRELRDAERRRASRARGRADANVAGNTNIAWAVKNNPQLELSYLHSRAGLGGAPCARTPASCARRSKTRSNA